MDPNLSSEPADSEVQVFDVDADYAEESPPTAQESMRYYGVDFDVLGLVRRLKQKDLIVPSFDPAYSEGDRGVEGFQRGFVWPKKQMDRFIESLLLGYPVPGIFLVERPDRRFLILDGQQRLTTLKSFYQGTYELPPGRKNKEGVFALENVGEQFQGKTYKTLTLADRRLLDSTVLQSTIVVPKEDNLEAVYFVFERINSTGIKLQPQEIRVALFSGELVHLLRELNTNTAWRALFGPPHSRLKDHELILRYLLLLESAALFQKHHWDREATRNDPDIADKIYRSGMASSLNKFLERHRDLQGLNKEKIIEEFSTAAELLLEGCGKNALKPRGKQVNAAHTDALLVGITLALRKGVKLTPANVNKINSQLLKDDSYMKSIMESTAHLESVITRLETAEKYFSEQKVK